MLVIELLKHGHVLTSFGFWPLLPISDKVKNLFIVNVNFDMPRKILLKVLQKMIEFV